MAFDNTRLFAFNFIPGTTTFADPNSRLGFSVTFVRVCEESLMDLNLEFGDTGRLMSESWVRCFLRKCFVLFFENAFYGDDQKLQIGLSFVCRNKIVPQRVSR